MLMSSRVWSLALLGWLSCVVTSAAAVPEKIGTLMQDRHYAEAIAAIDAELKTEKPSEPDYLHYLKGRALHLDGKYLEAVKALAEVETKYPKSQWARRARFAQGAAYARQGDYRKAEEVYRAEARFLLSEDRKQEIADLYLEFATAYFKPKDEQTKPDYNKALAFYRQALAVGPRADRRIEIELLVARCLQELGKQPEAIAHFQKFIKEHADTPLLIEARYRLGESQLAQNDFVAARRTWQDLLDLHAGAESERLAEAAYKLSQTWHIPQPNDNEELALGVASLESFIERYPQHKLAAQAHLRIAQSYQHRGRYEDAVKALQRLLADKRYAETDEVPDARNLLGHCYKLQQKFDEALAAWREYLTQHPTHQAWSDVQREIINTEFLKAQAEFQEKHYALARQLWGEFLVKYPLDSRNPRILELFGQMAFNEEKWEDAITQYRRLVSKYPGTNEASRAQYMVGLILEEKLHRLEESLTEYRKVTTGVATSVAQQRIGRLTARTMSIATERVFRSNETPRLKLASRNIDCVDVQVYVVDLETYFRKMHLARGVESLDIALIDPDASFKFHIKDYEKYRRFNSEIEIPLPKMGDLAARTSGVMAVTVTSKTLEATTLVLQSDLDMVVKSSRDEVFVFAQNMRTGKPWAGASVLISDGDKVFAEGVTGEDGVLQKSYKELKSAGDVRVFAVAEGNVASDVVGLSGVGVAEGLTNQGYVYTDRPAYRAGQVVHLRGVIRRVAGDEYIVPAEAAYELDVYDNRNRLMYHTDVALNDFGSFHAHFILPGAASQGAYRVLVHDAAGKENYQGAFQVLQYQLEPVQIEVESTRTTYYRGEEIVGTIKASYYYGAPLADREIRYQLAGGRVYTAKTNARGEVAFKLSTRDFRESQPLPLQVHLPERNLTTGKTFYLATLGFSIGVSTVQPVYLAGDSFEVTAKVVDAEGEPLAETLTLRVMRQTRTDDGAGEVQVMERELKTDKEQGTARTTLQLEKGGDYLLRVEGTDRFENRIANAARIKISDDSDSERLRILADRHTLDVGEKATVRLIWREEPALALITFQGARILDYRLVQLQKGVNKLPIPVTAKLAPNFELAVAVMTNPSPAAKAKPQPVAENQPQNDAPRPAAPAADEVPAEVAQAEPEARDEEAIGKPSKRLHLAASHFRVQRDLRVKLSIVRADGGQGAPLPGDAVKVAVTTTDPLGKPVAAEVSLALVEQALLSRFLPMIGPIDAYFRGTPRSSAMRTTSSVTFTYAPRTRPINPRLLAEEERLALAHEEAIRLEGLREGRDVLFAESGEEAPPSDAPNGAAGPIAGTNGAISSYDAGGYSSTEQTRALPGQGGGQLGWSQLHDGDTLLGTQTLQTLGLDPQSRRQSYWEQSESRQNLPQSLVLDSNRNQSGAFRAFIGMAASDENESIRDATQSYYRVPSVGLWKNLKGREQQQVQVFATDGTMLNVNLDRLSVDEADEKEVERLRKSGALILADLPPQETGYWNPAVTTDATGAASVTFNLPDRSTAWKLQAKGVTKETLAGEAEESLVVRKPLFGQLKLPAALTDGDQLQVVASVHNDLLDKGEVEVTLKTTIGDKTVTETRQLKVNTRGIHDLEFAAAMKLPADAVEAGSPGSSATFELIVAAGPTRDVVKRTVPVRPFGLPVFAVASGTASSDMTAFIEPAGKMPMQGRSLQILIGPNVEQSLIDTLLAPAPVCQLYAGRIAADGDTAVSDLMAALALLKLFGASRDAGSPQVSAIDARVRSSLALLVSAQQDDGGWGRGAGNDASHRYHSARVVWGLQLASAAGYRVADSALERGTAYLKSQLAGLGVADYESKAILLHALSAAGQGDFPLANQLFRNRPSLSTAGLIYLTLALAEMDRNPMAEELLAMVAARPLTAAQPRGGEGRQLAWSHDATELRALYALALDKVRPNDPQLAEQTKWLMAHRTGYRWSPDKATGPAMQALASWYARTTFEADRYELTIFVNDLKLTSLLIDKDSPTRTLDVPAKLLTDKPRQLVRFEVKGRGRFSYQCVLAGFVPTDKLQSTTTDWQVTRTYEPAPLEVEGREVPRGFDILQGNHSTFRNDLSQLPVARRAQVSLYVRRNNFTSSTPQEELAYLTITEPIPAGATVIEKSIKGPFDRYELSPGAITFYVGSRPYVGTIHYDLHGYLPGDYRTAPTVARNTYSPDEMAVAEAKSLKVLTYGEQSSDKYRLTPRELYELGKLRFDAGDMAGAGKHLSELFAKWNLSPQYYKETARMLLDVHLQQGPAKDVVRYFEIVMEKYPEFEIPFEKLLQVGDAYRELGEYERSYLVFRATVEASFLRESQVAGFLQERGEFQRSVEVMSSLLRQYPPEAYIAAATYALAQRVYAKAPEAAGDAKLRDQHVTRVDLIRRAIGMLDGFLTAHSEDPAADEASFSLATALLELELYPQAIAACDRYANRYPKSDFLDSYWYITAYCHYALAQHKEALAMSRKVAEARRLNPQTGREEESRNKWRAIYILGQIYHSLGQAEKAIEEYSRVKERFVDARQAIDFFAHKEIELPEVSAFKPGEAVEVELKFRNVASCDLKVYRIDLMKFGLLKRDLAGITQINLAGIRPYHEATIELGDGKDFRDRQAKLPAPLKEQGAYLLVCRAENLYSSGLVLVSPLELQIQEEETSGRVRATVKNVVENHYVADVHVKAIGSGNQDFVSGETDLRGIFVADEIRGRATVIAKADDGRYAFYRGEQVLGPHDDGKKPQSGQPSAAPPQGESKGSGKMQLLDELQRDNGRIRMEQQKQLQDLYENDVKDGIRNLKL